MRPSDELTSVLRPALAVMALLLSAGALAQTHPLNDTGQTTCYDASASTGSVSGGTPDPEAAGFDEQDCTQGRAAADAVGVLYKVGGSSRLGADYTRIANNGSELPANATLGTGPTDWACTRDNLSGLIWEVKVNNATNLRDQNHTYTWYDTNMAVNGNNAGFIGSDTTCNSTLTNCNTTAFRDAVNIVGLCGASDWRLPTADELQSLLHYGLTVGPLIDATWFPDAPPNCCWSGQNYSPIGTRGWLVTFSDGNVNPIEKFVLRQVRLVRGAP